MLNPRAYTRLHSRESFELLPRTQGIPTTAIVVDEGEGLRTFTEETDFRRYLEQFPEAENDQGIRLFKYGPTSPANLLLLLFSKFNFNRFSLIARGLSPSPFLGLSSGVCNCSQCKGGTRCAFRGLECSISFWRYADSSPDAENRLEVTGNDKMFAIYAGGQ